jgi:hypothetical protein
VGGKAFLRIIKALLLQRRVVIYGSPAGAVSAAVLGVAACLPCALDLLATEPMSSPTMDSCRTPKVVDDWETLGLPTKPGWLSGGAVAGFQPHVTLQALGEVLSEGDSGGRLLGCSPNVARLLLAQMNRAADSHGNGRGMGPDMRADVLCDMNGASGKEALGNGGAVIAAGLVRGGGSGVAFSGALCFGNAELKTLLALTKAELAFGERLLSLAEAHERDLFHANVPEASSADDVERRQAAEAGLELRLQGLVHSYIGAMLATAGSELRSSGELGDKRPNSYTGELRLRHGDKWVAAWQRTGAFAAWAARLPLLQIHPRLWPRHAASGGSRSIAGLGAELQPTHSNSNVSSGGYFASVSWLWRATSGTQA